MKSVVIAIILVSLTAVSCLPQLSATNNPQGFQNQGQSIGFQNQGQQDFPYNITVVIPDDNHDRQEGKLYVVLEGNSFQHEMQLTPHSTPLRPGNSYSYYVSAPYPIERIESVLLHWKKKRFSNLLGSSVLHVKSVIFEPAYVTGTLRTSTTKKFCADQDPVELTTEVKYKFWIACGF